MTTGITRRYEPFVLMDRADDELILQELKGRVADVLAYRFTDSEGNVIEGLSKKGVDTCCREMAKHGEVLRELEMNVIETEDAYLAQVRVGRYAINANGQEILLDTAFGVKRQSKLGRRKDGTPYENPFAYEQAVIKAARNAKLRLIPEDLQQKILMFALAEKKVKQLEGRPRRERKAEEQDPERQPQSRSNRPDWSKFWPVVREEFRIDDKQVYDLARLYFKKADLKRLDECITTQEQLDEFLQYLRGIAPEDVAEDAAMEV